MEVDVSVTDNTQLVKTKTKSQFLLESEERSPVLTFSPHPLLPDRDRGFIFATFLKGESVEQYLIRAGILERIGNQPFVLTINGRRVPRELWSKCYPHPGTILNLCALVKGQGGGGGSSDSNKVPRTVFSIAIIVISYYFFGPGGSATSALGLSPTVAALAMVGTALLGQFVATSLFPLPKPKSKDTANDSPTYGIDGGSNQIRRYEPFPKIYGYNRFFPDFGSQPYTEFSGEDQIAYYVFDFGYNDLVITDFRIGDTLLSTYAGVQLEESPGMTGVLNLFPANVDSIAGAQLQRDLGPLVRTSSVGTTALAVEITGSLFRVRDDGSLNFHTWSCLIEYSPTGQNQWTIVQSASDTDIVLGNSFGIAFLGKQFFATQGGTLQPGEFLIINNTRTPVRRTIKWSVPSGQYDVRVTVTHEDDGRNDPKLESQMFWTQLRSYQPDQADYTGRKRLAMKITASAQISGHIEQLNCLVSAKCPVWVGLTVQSKVPVFMPYLAGQGWNGSVNDDQFTQQETSNPAWWFLDAVRGKYIDKEKNATPTYMPYIGGMPWGGVRKVYGAGQADIHTDLENIKAFGAWCDAQGLKFNFVLDQQQSVFSVLQMLALSGRGSPTWGTGKLGVIWDQPSLPVTAVFGMHNIIAGTFEITYASETPPDVIEGEWINPDLSWQRDYVRVQVPGQTTQNNLKRVQLIGRTDKTLAAQDTNLYAAQVAYRNRRYKWQTDWEGFPCSRGDVILLSHDLAALDYTGRFIEGGNEASLILSRVVPLYTNGGFIVIIRPDGAIASYGVKGGSGSTNTLVPVNALPFNPWSGGWAPYDYRWAYGATSTPGKKLKIDSVRPVNERNVELQCVDELDYFYTAKDNPFTYTPPETIFGTVTIKSVVLSVDGVRTGAGYLAVVTATWDVEGDYSHAEVSLSVDGGSSTIIAQTEQSRSVQFNVIDGSDVEVKVTVYSTLGVLSKTDSMTVDQIVDFASQSPPGDVSDFALAGNTFSWSPVGDVDVSGYQIRFFYGDNANWNTASALHDGLLTASPWTAPTLPIGQPITSFLIKAIDAAGIESVNATQVVKDLGDLPIDNVVVTRDFSSPTWLGALTNGFINGQNQLEATSTVLMWESASGTLMWGTGTDLMWANPSFLEMTYEDTYTVPIELAGYTLSVIVSAQANPLTIEYRDNTDTAMWTDGDDAEMMWIDSTGPAVPAFMAGTEGMAWHVDNVDDVPAYMSYLMGWDWDYMWGPFGSYKPWTGQVTSQETVYEFRITTGQGATKGLVSQFAVTIDVPDITEQIQLLSVPPQGIRLPILKRYRAITVVNITLQHISTTQAVSAKWLDKSVEFGPLIQCFDTNNNPTAGVVNVLVEGY